MVYVLFKRLPNFTLTPGLLQKPDGVVLCPQRKGILEMLLRLLLHLQLYLENSAVKL